MPNLLYIPFGSRNVGWWNVKKYGNQKPVDNFEGIVDLVDEHQCLDNIGISVCTFKDGISYLLFLPFDFDSDDLKIAWKDATTLYNYIVKLGYDCHITFSGRKGFHVFLSVKPKPYSKLHIKTIQKYFKEKLNLKTLDEQIFGDIRRLMRIPWTYNVNGDLCREISYNQGALLDLDLLMISEKFEHNYEIKSIGKGYHRYPCIEKLIREDPEPRHLIRYSYVLLRLDKGWSEDKIINEIKGFDWLDFDESYTRKQIEHIDAGNYHPLACKTIQDLGFCPGKCKHENASNLERLGVI